MDKYGVGIAQLEAKNKILERALRAIVEKRSFMKKREPGQIAATALADAFDIIPKGVGINIEQSAFHCGYRSGFADAVSRRAKR